MTFNIINKIIFIDSFQFLSSPLERLVKILGKNDFKYLSQDLDSKVLDLVKQKGLHPYEYISGFESFKKKLPQGKKIFIVPWLVKKISEKEYEYVVKVWNKFEMKTVKEDHNLYLKHDALLLDKMFKKFRSNSLKDHGLCPSH